MGNCILNVYLITFKIVALNTMDWHSCFTSTIGGVRTTVSLPNCQEQCLLTPTCTGISYCRQTGVCHVVSVPLDIDNVVTKRCPGCVVFDREEMQKDLQHDAEEPKQTIIGCNINVPDLIGCRIRGNMHHSGHRIQVQCDLLKYYCRNSTFSCGTNGAWTFEKCLLPILASNDTCVPSITPYGQLTNVALGKAVQMSSHYNGVSPGSIMVDGVRNPGWPCACTRLQTNPYMIIDLENTYSIYSVYLLNRYYCCPERLRDFDISFSESMATLSQRLHHTGAVDQDCTFILDPPVIARYVKIQINGYEFLTICEFEIYGSVVEI